MYHSRHQPDYPQWRLPGIVKTYYLLELSYWCQQFLLITLRVEKPRKDFIELVLHHIVTLWLVGWSYLINSIHIGNAVFITMDCSDVFLSVRANPKTGLLSTDRT